MTLSHTPAYVLRQVMIDLGLGTLPSSSGAWPIYAHAEPPKPDSCMTLKDTTGEKFDRGAVTGKVVEHYGVQIRLRDADPNDGYVKIHDVMDALNEDITYEPVTVTDPTGTGTSTYTVYAITCKGTVNPLGKDPNSNRWLWTLNVTISLHLVT